MNEEIDLLPCPFCGSEAKMSPPDGEYVFGYGVRCLATKSGSCIMDDVRDGYGTDPQEAPLEAAKAWNRRVCTMWEENK